MQHIQIKTHTAKVKKPVGIDFDIQVKKKEKKEVEGTDVPDIAPVYNDSHYEDYKNTNDKNLFEEVIEKMMIESCMDETFKPYIEEIKEIIGKKLPTKKRFAILCTLDKNRNLLRKAKVFNNNPISKAEHIVDYMKILRKYVEVSDVEKKKFGEVMTPIDLVKEMLQKLPKEVWTNPKLKWLDPCNGVGPFGAAVVAALMNGLKKWESDEEKRYKHIIENMVYVCELQPKNMFLWMCMMDPKNEYDMNIYCGSFLDGGFDKHMKEVWGIDKFDIIVGNPPYQKSIDGGSTDKPLWHFFVHSFKEGQDTFNAAINFDYYCLNNSENKGNTKIVCEDKEELFLDLRTTDVIPSENVLEILSLVAKEGEDKVELISNSSYHHTRDYVSKDKTNENIYPCVYTVKTNDEPTLKWSSVNDKGHFGISKVIFANGASGVIADIDGKYGMTQYAYAIVDKPENVENIAKAISSERFIKKIMLFKNSLGDRYNRKIIARFRKDFWKELVSE